jgi:hypothetical protein
VILSGSRARETVASGCLGGLTGRANTFTDREQDLHEEWSEIDATGRVVHAFRSPPYVHGLVPQEDGSVLIVRGILGTQEVWRIAGTRSTLIGHVPLANTFWEFDVASGGPGAVAVLATSSMTGSDDAARFDPRLIVPGRFATVLAHGTFRRGVLRALAAGGWLVELRHPFPDDRHLMLVRVDERGTIVWTSSSTSLPADRATTEARGVQTIAACAARSSSSSS